MAEKADRAEGADLGERERDMVLYELTRPEINRIIETANFTDDEKRFFLLRAADKSVIAACREMSISERTASRLSARVKKKIIKVL